MSDRIQHILPAEHSATAPYDVDRVREDFPILQRTVNGRPLVYFDNAATTQKPRQVIDCLVHYYSHVNANVHRGIHTLSQEASDLYEKSRLTVQQFINAASEKEVIFTTGTTGGINLVATSMSRGDLKSGDEIIVTEMEHHSNIVPWQLACEQTGATLKVVPVLDNGTLDMEAFSDLLSEKTKLVSVGHTSNALGTINPIEDIIQLSHDAGALVLIDGAQAVPHAPVDVQTLDADFFCFSSHKVYGPTGFGILHGKEDLLERMAPYQGGGDMIETVSFESTTYNSLPHKFEAGTPDIAGAIAFAAALDYVSTLGISNIQLHEQHLVSYATQRLEELGYVRIIGDGSRKASVISFLIGDVHPYDAGTLLDGLGIAVRTGHHCAMPLMSKFQIPGTVRASFGLYSTVSEIDTLISGISRVQKMFS